MVGDRWLVDGDRYRWLVIGDRCPVLGFGSFFNFSIAGFADLSEAEQVVEGAIVCAFETGRLAVQHLQ